MSFDGYLRPFVRSKVATGSAVGSFGQGPSLHQKKLAVLGGLLGGLVVGGLATTGLTAALGRALRTAVDESTTLTGDGDWRLIAVSAIVIVVIVTDVTAARHGGYSVLGLRRQTPQALHLRIPSDTAISVIRGLDVGTGVTTYRVTGAIWIVVASCLLGLAPAWSGAAYGLGFFAALVWAMALDSSSGSRPLPSRLRRVQVIAALAGLSTLGLLWLEHGG